MFPFPAAQDGDLTVGGRVICVEWNGLVLRLQPQGKDVCTRRHHIRDAFRSFRPSPSQAAPEASAASSHPGVSRSHGIARHLTCSESPLEPDKDKSETGDAESPYWSCPDLLLPD